MYEQRSAALREELEAMRAAAGQFDGLHRAASEEVARLREAHQLEQGQALHLLKQGAALKRENHLLKEDLAAAEAELAGWYETMQRETNALKRAYQSSGQDLLSSPHEMGPSSPHGAGPRSPHGTGPGSPHEAGPNHPRSAVRSKPYRAGRNRSNSHKIKAETSDGEDSSKAPSNRGDADESRLARKKVEHKRQSVEKIVARQLPQVKHKWCSVSASMPASFV